MSDLVPLTVRFCVLLADQQPTVNGKESLNLTQCLYMYLTPFSTHLNNSYIGYNDFRTFFYYKQWFIDRINVCLRKEGNVLFNDPLKTFHLWLYGIKHMVKDHSDSERGNPLLPHGVYFLISRQWFFYIASSK